MLPQDLLVDLKTTQDSLIVLQELGEELKSQVEASAAAAIQSDQLSLNQNLSTLEQILRKQQTVLQVLQRVFSVPASSHLVVLENAISQKYLGKEDGATCSSAFPNLP